MEQSPTPIRLQVCPSCKQQSLILNEANNMYECLNTKCRETFFRASVDKYNQQIESDQEALNTLSEKSTKAWFGNQYYDSKKRKWRDGMRPKRVKLGRNNWLWIVIGFIIISLVITLILNFFFPGIRFFIIGW